MLPEFLEKIDFSEKEQVLYLSMIALGPQPASAIARRANIDRVTAYKHLKKLAERGFVTTFYRDGVQCFSVENFDAFEEYLAGKREQAVSLLQTLPTALQVLHSLKGDQQSLPQLQIFEGEAGIRALFRDMQNELRQEALHQIRILSSNTYAEQSEDLSLRKTVRDFFTHLQNASIEVELFEATGALVPEYMRSIPSTTLLSSSIPIVRGTTNIFLVGHVVYVASYKNTQVGVKLRHEEFSQIFHFLFDFIRRSVARN